MPVNSDGETVDENGESIDPKDLETANWVDVATLNLKNEVKPYSVELLAPTSIPTNIPYFEAYRTDELYYKEYKSSFLSDTGNTSTDSTDTDSSSTTTGGTDDTGSSSTGSSSSKYSAKAGATYSSKTKNSKLKTEISNVVKRYYKSSANYNTIINRYIKCKTNLISIAVVTSYSNKWLYNKSNASSLNKAIYNAKHKYG